MVYDLENFRTYSLGMTIVVQTNHTALRYLMAMKEAKSLLIRQISLLQVFDFEVKEQKGCENKVFDHVSFHETNHEKVGEIEIDDIFPDEIVMSISRNVAPQHADYANYVISDVLPYDLNYHNGFYLM